MVKVVKNVQQKYGKAQEQQGHASSYFWKKKSQVEEEERRGEEEDEAGRGERWGGPSSSSSAAATQSHCGMSKQNTLLEFWTSAPTGHKYISKADPSR